MTINTFDELMKFVRETAALEQVCSRLSWDMQTVMPAGAAHQRAEEFAAMEAVLHYRKTNPQMGEWIGKAEPPDEEGAAKLRLIHREYNRKIRVPMELSVAIARQLSRSHQYWLKAREEGDFSVFAPALQNNVSLKLEEAAAMVGDDEDPYDVMVDNHEREMTADRLAVMFDEMRPRLVALRETTLSRNVPHILEGDFDEQKQMILARELAELFGYDLNRGRIDLAVHPFSCGSGADVRITTRTAKDDPLNCIYSTLHETGHACYEQAVNEDYFLSPLGMGASMGVHESQSRIYENQLGRSRAFCSFLFGRLRDLFGEIGVANEDELYAAVNRVKRDCIRTEADEVQYNLHVMLRFDLERALFAGDLDINDIEEAWNDRFSADFGFEVDVPINGILQDIHWAYGEFGYFPTYTLGNIYAGCLYKSLTSDIPNLDDQLANGNPEAAIRWLRDRVHVLGRLKQPHEIISGACGFEPTTQPLLDYIEEKFHALYDI